MSKARHKRQMEQRCWVGLDWGSERHTVSVVNDARELVAEFKTGTSLAELQGLAKRLLDMGTVAGIAIEATRNPVVGCLASAGFTIYPINPKMSKEWRKCSSVASVKNDRRDGLVLAMELAVRHASLRPLKHEDPCVAELGGLCEKLRDLIDQRTELVQRLKATLGQYYPGVLEFFSDWTSPVAWRFVKRFARPEILAQARKETLIRFLKANRIGLKPLWIERVDARAEVARWPRPADSLALEQMALATVAQLQALEPHIAKLDALVAQAAKDLPYTRLMRSLPGAGQRLAPALAAIIAVAAVDEADVQGLRCISGVAPVEDASGKRQRVKMRRRCNKHWRNVTHLFAQCSTAWCAWAKAFYDMHREQGDRHACALRKLADKWFKIINRMIETGEPYDDQRYVEALRRAGSPVYQRLCGKPCG